MSTHINEVHLIRRIEELLTKLEACHSGGLPLPVEDVALVASLIRLYATAKESGYETWLDREHARHIARIFKSERLLGSAIERPKDRLKLNGPTASEILAQSVSEPLEISLFDLVKSFQEVHDQAVSERKRRHLHDPV